MYIAKSGAAIAIPATNSSDAPSNAVHCSEIPLQNFNLYCGFASEEAEPELCIVGWMVDVSISLTPKLHILLSYIQVEVHVFS